MAHTRILSRSVVFVLVALLTSGSAVWAQQGNDPWTTVGSAGTVDEADLLRVLLGSPVSGAVALRPGFGLFGGVRIRYNVVAVQGVLGGAGLTLTARFLDHGDGERVVVQLKKYGLNTGSTTTLLTLDSNAYAGSGTFQVQTVFTNACTPPLTTLDFVENSYFMDVTISRSRFPDVPPIEPPIFFAIPEPVSTGPALAMIRLNNKSICIE